MANDIQIFDFSVNLLRALLWQYNDAENLQGILNEKNAWYIENHTQFWQDWYVNVFDIRTANQFGLTVWGIILGLQLYVNTPPQMDKLAFGFDDVSFGNFDLSNFTDENGTTYPLPLETQRRALRLRYFQLTGSCTVPEINRILSYVFGDLGRAYVLDYNNMTQQYIFEFPVTVDLIYLFNNYDILPRAAGVMSNWIDATKTYFGFDPYGLNFDNGIFGS